jgi:glutamyl-tRNA reductase
MAIEDIEKVVQEGVKEATKHAAHCVRIINESGLSEAIEYCKKQEIDPPQCSLTASTKNAENQRAKASRMLCEVKWWNRRLKYQAIQRYENNLRKKGELNIFEDNDLSAYQKKHLRIR